MLKETPAYPQIINKKELCIMSKIWILSVKTSLPNVCESPLDLTLTTSAYDSFEKARNALRRVVKGYAFSENSMFDGDGRLTYFQEQIQDSLSEAEEEDLGETYLSRERLTFMSECLRAALAGEDVDFELAEDHYDDGCYFSATADYEAGSFSLVGDYEGPCNGINPIIHTNIFSMKEEKDYYLYLDDLFGQDDCSSELYIDLTCCDLQ